MTEQHNQEQLWQTIDDLIATKQLIQVKQARHLLRDWMKQHPEDYYSQDTGESLAMMEGALEGLEAQKLAEPAAV